MQSVIFYCRCSTTEQGKSNLGIEAQIADMTRFATLHDLNIVDIRREVVSGKYDLDRRPVLKQAFADADKMSNKTTECFVLTSKLDRLSRSEAFIHNLVAANRRFKVAECGMNASNIEMSLRVLIAAEERRKIGERIKSALAAKKARGEPMGMNVPNVAKHKVKIIQAGALANKTEADAFAEHMRTTITNHRKSGMSVHAVAAELNRQGTKTYRGKEWHGATVSAIMKRWEHS